MQFDELVQSLLREAKEAPEGEPIRVETQKLNHIGGVTARSHYQFSSQAKFEEVLPRLKMIYHRILVNGEELKDDAAEDNQAEYDYYHKVELERIKREAAKDALEDRIQDALAKGHIDQSDAKYIRKLGKFPDEDAEGKIDKDRMKCNSPRRTSGGSKKFVVKACKDGKEKVVRFGDPNMKIKKSNPKRRKSFRARHKCDQKKDKFSAGYWSCKKW